VRKVAIALLHHPVLGRHGETLTTTLTNLDLHDMARCARTYGLEGMFAVHPLRSQRLLAERIVTHWVDGAGGKRIPDRGEAMRTVRIVAHLEDVADALGGEVELWTTAARSLELEVVSYDQGRERLQGEGPPVVILFGTGWGLPPSLLEDADLRLEPIEAARDNGFNHLSVRAACAITLDRLLG
jgi:hypothetical protein